ncbi:MAG: hypothetical protein HY720_10485 [Planctomycetes bacterium]|nr:hypothetical protein [Planctomycetota bacterium]
MAFHSLDDPRVQAALTEALATSDHRVQQALRSTWKEIAKRYREDACRRLQAILRNEREDAETRIAACEILVSIEGRTANSHVVSLLESADRRTQSLALRALAALGDRASVRRIAAMLGQVFVPLQIEAARALAKIRGPEAVHELANALRAKGNRSIDARLAILCALGEIASDSSEIAKEALVESLQRKDDDEAWIIVSTLCDLRDPRGIPWLVDHSTIKTKCEKCRNWLISTLKACADVATIEQLNQVRDLPKKRRFQVIESIGDEDIPRGEQIIDFGEVRQLAEAELQRRSMGRFACAECGGAGCKTCGGTGVGDRT